MTGKFLVDIIGNLLYFEKDSLKFRSHDFCIDNLFLIKILFYLLIDKIFHSIFDKIKIPLVFFDFGLLNYDFYASTYFFFVIIHNTRLIK